MQIFSYHLRKKFYDIIYMKIKNKMIIKINEYLLSDIYVLTISIIEQ